MPTVAVLKDRLKARGLAVSGTKSELEQRLEVAERKQPAIASFFRKVASPQVTAAGTSGPAAAQPNRGSTAGGEASANDSIDLSLNQTSAHEGESAGDGASADSSIDLSIPTSSTTQEGDAVDGVDSCGRFASVLRQASATQTVGLLRAHVHNASRVGVILDEMRKHYNPGGLKELSAAFAVDAVVKAMRANSEDKCVAKCGLEMLELLVYTDNSCGTKFREWSPAQKAAARKLTAKNRTVAERAEAGGIVSTAALLLFDPEWDKDLYAVLTSNYAAGLISMIEDTPDGSESRATFRSAYAAASSRREAARCHDPVKAGGRPSGKRRRGYEYGYMSIWGDHSISDPDEEGWEEPSPLVIACQAGQLTKVKAWLNCCEGRRLAEMLAVAHKIQESEDKAGGMYTKEWTWFGDTPLHAAARHGHAALVRYLLLKGADPTLRCNSGGSAPGGTPADLATHRASFLSKHVHDLLDPAHVSASYATGAPDPDQIVPNLRQARTCVELLGAASTQWKNARYDSAHWDSFNARARETADNEPQDWDALRVAIAKVPEQAALTKDELAHEAMVAVAARARMAQQKREESARQAKWRSEKRVLQQERQEQRQQRKRAKLAKTNATKGGGGVVPLNLSTGSRFRCPGCGKNTFKTIDAQRQHAQAKGCPSLHSPQAPSGAAGWPPNSRGHMEIAPAQCVKETHR